MNAEQDPLQQLADDRAQARSQGDSMANLACLATATAAQAASRVLVLRDIDGELALFFSATSPKAAELANGAAPEVLVYLPSLNVQYRLRVHLRALPTDLLHLHWQRRPDAAKRIDWFYNTAAAQSTPIASRAVLQQAVADNAQAAPSSRQTEPPPGTRGYFLDVASLERLHIQDSDPPHDRRLYTRQADGWLMQVLVP